MSTWAKVAVYFQLIQLIAAYYVQPKFQFNSFSFTISLVDVGDQQFCSVQAENKVNPDGNIYKLDVGLVGIESLTDGLCRTPQILESYLKLAFMSQLNLSVENVHLNTDGELQLMIKYDLVYQNRSFSLYLKNTKLSNEIKLDKLFKQFYLSDDVFCAQPNVCYHEYLSIYHYGRAAVKLRTESPERYHQASTGIKYTKGIHYWEMRTVRSRQNRVLFGVAPELKSLINYPGSSPQETGRSLYSQGYLYADNASFGYKLGNFVTGDYVGVLLNMNNKTVAFSINGRYGTVLPVTDNGYYFVAALLDVGDSVEIVPNSCSHKDK